MGQPSAWTTLVQVHFFCVSSVLRLRAVRLIGASADRPIGRDRRSKRSTSPTSLYATRQLLRVYFRGGGDLQNILRFIATLS